jgi:hypothetical protein
MITDEDFDYLLPSAKLLPAFTQQFLIFHRYVLLEIPDHRFNETLASILEAFTNVDTDEKIDLFCELTACYPNKEILKKKFDKLMESL